MTEGWSGEDYLVLFSEDESHDKTKQYKLSEYLPGFRVVGLKGWDEFIVVAPDGKLSSVPTVPIARQNLQPYSLPSPLALRADERLLNQIKWYTKPIIFGGDPNVGENLTWISHEQHTELVNW